MCILRMLHLFTAVLVTQGWHLDICFYVATAYTVYYIWLNQVWVKIFPRFKWREPTEATEKTVNKDNKQCKIGQWVEAGVDATDEKGDPTAPSDQVGAGVLATRLTRGEH